jgi:hypothetical protein
MDRGAEEYYVSVPYELPVDVDIECISISWEAEIPEGTWVKGQLRIARSVEELREAKWMGPFGKDQWFKNEQKFDGFKRSGNWIQYRLAFGAINSLRTPRLTSVKITYVV